MTDVAAPWTGRILHVDLTSGEISHVASVPFAEDYLGGRGIAARLAWDMVTPGTGAFDAASPLFFMPGAVVGTPAPSAGRTAICGVSPQTWPHEWYTRSNLGGHWGAALRYAGYDGLVVTGRAASPVTLQIDDAQVALRDADHLWGTGLIATQRRLRAELPSGTSVLAIGPAGERRCRSAVAATGTESAAGQGGFGAVMGAKNLKAVTVRGTGGVRVADPREALRRSREVVRAVLRVYGQGGSSPDPADGRPGSLRAPCTHGCPRACGAFYAQVPGGVHTDRTYTGHLHCCSPIFTAKGGWMGADYGFRAGFEIAQTCNDLGINHWEIIVGLVPWLRRCQARGELTALDGMRLDVQDPASLLDIIGRIAGRQGYGDILAEGVPRAAQILGVGQDLVGEFYPAYGFPSHWDGHGSFPDPYYPYWLVTAVQWALDTRDPLGGGHGYTTNIYRLVARLASQADDPAVRARLLEVGARLYGTPSAVDPRSDYAGKAMPGVFHQDRNALKDCLGICDNIFPMLTDPASPDYLCSLDGVDGPRLEHYLFEPLSDIAYEADAFYRIGTRVFTLERLLGARNWGRSRRDDEAIIPYLMHPERAVSPYVGHSVALDASRFRALLDECYALRGWDRGSGLPGSDTLHALGLDGLD